MAQPGLVLLLWLAGLMLLNLLLASIGQWIRVGQSEAVQDYLAQLIHHQATTIDFAFYESADYYNRLYRAQIQAKSRPLALLENLGNLLKNTITLVALAGLLIPFGAELIGALLASTLPALYILIRHKQRERQWQLQITPMERKAWYFDQVLTQKHYAAELRLLNLGPYFIQAYQAVRAELRQQQLQLKKNQILGQLAAGLIALLGVGLTLLWLLWQTFHGQLSLGDLVLLYQAFNRGQSASRAVLANGSEIYGSQLFLADLFQFLDSQPQIQPPLTPLAMPTELAHGIRFEQVSFAYPDSPQAVLTDFELEIPAGKIVAIVGTNGAGKSTLFKLLCRLYDPTAGRITLDGHELRQFDPAALRRQISILLQEPVHYHATVADNIALGEIAPDSAPEESIQVQQAAQAAAADAFIAHLPQGYDTLLGKWLDNGTELSGGQWQRVALARAFYRQAALILLDEPTSALDSWAETDWLNRFRQLANGRTALIITHRFTTAMHADQIHVMEAGRMVESGTHQQLLALNGRYAQSWQAQMRELASPN